MSDGKNRKVKHNRPIWLANKATVSRASNRAGEAAKADEQSGRAYIETPEELAEALEQEELIGIVRPRDGAEEQAVYRVNKRTFVRVPTRQLKASQLRDARIRRNYRVHVISDEKELLNSSTRDIPHVFRMWVKSKWLNGPRDSVRIAKPPGSRLLSVAEFLYSKKTFERTFEPVIADMRYEYNEAIQAGRLRRARWVCIRGTIAFLWSIPSHHVLAFVGKVLSKLTIG